MGFLTDAYDLFIIGIVVEILPLSGWNPMDTTTKAFVSSIALLGAAIGALAFGSLLDRFGRKQIYGLEAILLIVSALGSAFLTPVNSTTILSVWRFILGFGIGGDYANSATIMTEYSNRTRRGMLVGMVFSMQAVGLVLGPLVSIALITSNIPLATIWKLLFAFGAIPSAMVIYSRWTLPETPKYSAIVIGEAAAKENRKRSHSKLSRSESRDAHRLPAITLLITLWELPVHGSYSTGFFMGTR